MSKATKKKHVVREVMDEFVLPEQNQKIVKVIASKGNNLHEVQTEKDETFLVSMPTKFRKNVWIKRGDYVLIDPIEEGDKVKGEIVTILYKDQIKYIKEEGKWPTVFDDNIKSSDNNMIPDDLLPPSDSDSDNEGLADKVVNANRQQMVMYEEEEEEDSSDEEVDSEKEGKEK